MSQPGQTDLRRTEFIGAHVEPELAERLTALAREQDRSVSSVIRRAVAAHVERERNDR